VKRMRLLACVVLVVLIALNLTPAAAKGKGNPKATGGGTTVEGGEKSTFVFNAVQHKNGSVNGHLVYHFREANFSFRMKIDCLNITGNQAILSGVVTKVSSSAFSYVFVGQRGVFVVIDNGQGKHASPDLISDVILDASATCASSSLVPYLPISGNIKVSG
jgi:hypothetical protein